LDASFAAASGENRWNSVGEPTLYLAGDVGVAAAEWARHIDAVALPFEIIEQALPRRIWEVEFTLDRVLDLRQTDLWEALAIEDAPECFMVKSKCQEISGNLRRNTDAQALLVPSIAFLDQLERWAMVLFADKVSCYPESCISIVEKRGTLPKHA
jgi:RES domain-containing protein